MYGLQMLLNGECSSDLKIPIVGTINYSYSQSHEDRLLITYKHGRM
jgi:hypothetical protein